MYIYNLRYVENYVYLILSDNFMLSEFSKNSNKQSNEFQMIYFLQKLNKFHSLFSIEQKQRN
jgi:hypothetical protein